MYVSNLPLLVHSVVARQDEYNSMVPQDEWSGYPEDGDKDEEIPCRRMRSSSYVKAMGEGDNDSGGESDGSPKTSPQKAIRPDALVLKSVMQRPHIDPQR
ncbi:hypothetical protein DPEC_G00088160 [Dallia pectoralis]|uniref:Uncharacterized protein n=1 Tax=Dallia pectoralis TaxID=75939 RepID=A0ACC2H1E0_DALPE|nr:hypothetical protein DPEC_G00088160 [Dallia pectoralis]